MKINYTKKDKETSFEIEIDKSIDKSLSKIITAPMAYIALVGALFTVEALERLVKIFV